MQKRIFALRTLKKTIEQYEEEIYQALYLDLNKSKSESYMCEVGMVYSELNYMIKHVKKFAKAKRVHTPIAQAVSKSYVQPSPKGVVLIMSPWNYPFMLTIDPLVDALAAGNTAIIKPSAYAPHTAKVLEKIISEAFDPAYVATVQGGRAENQALLNQAFDHIFFTGSSSVGKEVLRKASDHLTSVTLELGGKSPCIVDASANIKIAAKRIVFGKFLNCGQTCVAPDYILCERSIVSDLKDALIQEIQSQFGNDAIHMKTYGKIINEKHYLRLKGIIEKSKIAYGGSFENSSLKIEPTMIYPCTWQDAVMEDEIFGPLLPILTYDSLDDVIEQINAKSSPLACYMFSNDKQAINKVTTRCQFGGGCINDTIIHLATTNMGFGGINGSGMGAYHGKVGFDTFSHHKSIVDKKTWIDLPMRYQPYTTFYDKIIRLFLR